MLLVEEVGSGGFDSYISHHSNLFYETINAAEILNKPLTAKLLIRIAKKFPNGEVPDKPEKAEAYIMDNDLDFEAEDEYIYEVAEKDLVQPEFILNKVTEIQSPYLFHMPLGLFFILLFYMR